MDGPNDLPRAILICKNQYKTKVSLNLIVNSSSCGVLARKTIQDNLLFFRTSTFLEPAQSKRLPLLLITTTTSNKHERAQSKWPPYQKSFRRTSDLTEPAQSNSVSGTLWESERVRLGQKSAHHLSGQMVPWRGLQGKINYVYLIPCKGTINYYNNNTVLWII